MVSVCDFAALEADVNLGGPFHRHLDEGDVLNEVGEQPLAFAGWRIRICPKLAEVCCHGDQALADSFIEDELVLLSSALSIFTCFCQHAELLVPFTFERVGDETIIGVDQHETALGEICFDLGPFDRAAAQPVCFLIPDLDLSADLERQLDGGRRHLFGNQHADGLVDRRPGDRLTGIAAMP